MSLNYRKSRGFFGQLLDRLTGSDRDRQLLLDGNLIAGQQTLHNWVLELTDSLRISQLGLQITQKSLLEARNIIRLNKSRLQHQERAIIDIAEQLSKLTQQIDNKFKTIEARIHQLETKVAANEDLDAIISAWEANQTYHDFPWLIQIILLVKEIFSSAVITYELETQDLEKYRRLIINKILARSIPITQNFFSLAELLDLSSCQLEIEDLPLCAAILEIRSFTFTRLNSIPLLFAVGTTLEFSQLPPETQPHHLGKSAIALCRQQINYLPRQMDARELVSTIVNEIANDSLSQLIACQSNL
ncbi:hypothetical protein [Pleurocapsa sp. PCC 7319]|uniref:hypothetical protein n=1 Tax=Pleurocapsa sp. PCC 7319 TaxID=118161 RepID=UPI0003478A1B|nr:hypothetical protein [Pleurocapsa sp. PCC 7319]